MKTIKNKLITSLALILSLSAFADTKNAASSAALDYYVTIDGHGNMGYRVTSGTLVLSTMPSWSGGSGLALTTEGGGAISIAGDIEGSVTDNSRIIIDGGTLTTSSDIRLNNNEYAGGTEVTMVSGKISTSGTIELSEGLTSVDEGSSLSLDGIVSVGDEMDAILGSEGSNLVITRDGSTGYYNPTVRIGKNSSLTLAGDITLGDYVDIEGLLNQNSTLAIATNSVVNSTIYEQGLAGINIGDDVVFSSWTAFDIRWNPRNVTNLDGDIVFYRPYYGGAGIGYNISSEGITLGGSTSVNISEGMPAYDGFFDQVVGIYLSNSSGAVSLADGFSLSTMGMAIRDGGNRIFEAIMAATGDITEYTQGITLTLLGSATLEGDIISYGGITLEGNLFNAPGSSSSYIRELTVINGLISAGDSLYHNDITIYNCILALENSTLTTYSQTGDCYGALDIKGSLVLDNSTASVGDTDFSWKASLTLLNDSEITINGDLTLTWGSTFNIGEGSKATVTGDVHLAKDTILYVNAIGSASSLVDGVYASFIAGLGAGQLVDGEHGEFTYDNATGEIIVSSLTYFQDQATTANEQELATSLDSIASTGDAGMDTNLASFKSSLDEVGLGSNIMHSASYMSEVNTMLLSNLNYASVNRARAIVGKSNVVSNKDMDLTQTFEFISESEGKEKVESASYGNFAQLQSINLLGSKKGNNEVAGYDYWSVGSLATVDMLVDENLIMGISLGGSYNKVSGESTDSANSTAFLLNAYAAAKINDFDLFANFGYAHFWNEGSSNGANADWDSNAINFIIGGAYNIELPIDGLTLSPIAMLNLVLLDNGDALYSNSVLVEGDSYISAKLMLGLEASYAITSKFNSVIRLMYAHEFGDDSFDMTYGFSSGYLTGVNYSGSKLGRDSAVLGLGLSYDFSDRCVGFIDYNANIYDDLVNHSLNLSVGFRF